MRPHSRATLSCLLALALVPALTAAPPKEERVIVEAGYDSFYSPDGKWLAFKSGLLKLGLVSTAPRARPFPEGDFSYAAFTADSKFLVAVESGGKKVQFLNLATGKTARV